YTLIPEPGDATVIGPLPVHAPQYLARCTHTGRRHADLNAGVDRREMIIGDLDCEAIFVAGWQHGPKHRRLPAQEGNGRAGLGEGVPIRLVKALELQCHLALAAGEQAAVAHAVAVAIARAVAAADPFR